MSGPQKFLFDECLGKPLLEDIKSLLAWDNPAPVISHTLDYFKSGTCDSVWIPEVAKDGWVIITGDRGKKGKKPKLPVICLHYKITHILMTGTVMRLKQNQKANAVVAVWEDIKKCANAPPGSRFILQMSHQGNARIRPVTFPASVAPLPA